MPEYRKFLVLIEYPHEYSSDRTALFSNQEEAKNYAENMAKGRSGYSGYVRTSVYKLKEEVN